MRGNQQKEQFNPVEIDAVCHIMPRPFVSGDIIRPGGLPVKG